MRGRDGEAVVGRRARCGRGEGEGGRRRLGDRERGRPLALQDVEADATVAVDVAVVNLRREGHLTVRWAGGMRRAEEAGARRGAARRAARGARPGFAAMDHTLPHRTCPGHCPRGEQERKSGGEEWKRRRGGRAGGARRASSAHARGAPNAARRPHQAPIPTRLLCASACSLRRCGVDLWRLEGVVGGEVDVQEKDAALIRRLLLRSAGGRGQAVRPSAAQGPASRREDRTGPIMVDCQ